MSYVTKTGVFVVVVVFPEALDHICCVFLKIINASIPNFNSPLCMTNLSVFCICGQQASFIYFIVTFFL